MSQKKVLLLASVASMIQQFNLRNIDILQQLGCEVEVACNFEKGNTCDPSQTAELKKRLSEQKVVCHQIDFSRNVFRIRENGMAYAQLKVLFQKNCYDLVHCHSPIGGVLGRLAAHKYHVPVVYTAHGFHFYKGAPMKNWLLFYPVEKLLSYWTDQLVVINREDYQLAKDRFHMKNLQYVPGVGVKISEPEKNGTETMDKRRELGISQDAFVIVSVAEFTANKNQETVIHALEHLKQEQLYYLMCGIGEKQQELKQYVEQRKLGEHIRFLGFRKDIHEILEMSDCFVLSSLREGLSVALMEAMAEGLPVVCGRIRGNVDLIQDGTGGYLVSPENQEEYQQAFLKMFEQKKNHSEKFSQMGEANRQTVKQFACEPVDKMMREIYQKGLK